MTLVCVPIMVSDVSSASADAGAARAAGADLVEFRADGYYTGDAEQVRAIVGLVERSPLPCIVTCRAAAEGGEFSGSDDELASLIHALTLSTHPPRYIDVELATFLRPGPHRRALNALSRPDTSPSLILSVHDFRGRPTDFLRRAADLGSQPAAAVIKTAYLARSLRDSLELLDLASHAGRPAIALGMGEFGLLTRVLAPKFYGFLTFASLRRETTTAPGQPTIHDLLHLYRFRTINAATKVYGVVGWPVTQSLSPHVHNAGFESAGHNGVYLPLPIAAGDDPDASYASFKGTLLDLAHDERLDLCGCSVTIPHKPSLVRLAREQGWSLDAAAGATGAGNTLTLERDGTGRLVSGAVTNTDAAAISACLRESVPLSGRNVLVLGAGGAARAAAWACASDGARVTIYARSRARAIGLAAHMGSLGLPHASHVDDPLTLAPGIDAVVNCTPVGMAGGPDERGIPIAPAALASLPSHAVVFDTVYRPVRTPLLRAAEARGLRTISGMEMFVRQAAAQFETWTGSPAPTALFRRVAEESSPS